METEVPNEWKKVIIVPLNKSRDSKDECNDYQGISLLNVPGRVYGSVFMERHGSIGREG